MAARNPAGSPSLDAGFRSPLDYSIASKGLAIGAPNALQPGMNGVINSNPDPAAHPAERALSRYAANDMGARTKKSVAQHLEGCEDCRKVVSRYHALARTYRDWERTAISHAAQAERAN